MISGRSYQKLQILSFSGINSPDGIDLARQIMRSPFRIECKEEELTVAGVSHYYVSVEREVGILSVNKASFRCYECCTLGEQSRCAFGTL